MINRSPFLAPYLSKLVKSPFVSLRSRLDPDALAFYAAAAPSPAEQAFITPFFIGTKADNVWSKFDGGNILSLSTAAKCYYDFKVPSRVATVAGTPTFTFTANRGFTGSGAAALSETDYVQNGYIPSSGGGNWTQNSMHLFGMSHTVASSAGFEIGCNGTHDAYIRFNSATTMICRANTSGNVTSVTVADGAGFMGISRIGAADTRYFDDGAQVGATALTASTGMPDAAVRYLEVQSLASSIRQLSFACFGGGLTTAEVALLNTRVQTMITGLRSL